MVETFIFGHKSPDSDSITSSIVMTNLEKELGNSEAKAYRLGNINKETDFILNYLDMDAPELLESVEDGANVISCIGLVIFLVYNVRYVLIFCFVDFQVEDFPLGFS